MKTIQDFAALLDGREYKKEMTEDEIIQARKLGFVIVFGCSDDRTVFTAPSRRNARPLTAALFILRKKAFLRTVPATVSIHRRRRQRPAPSRCDGVKAPMSGPTEQRFPMKALRSLTISPQKISSSVREWCLT